MRVIAGSAKRAQLITPKGKTVRPTTDRVKETLFNIIGEDVQDSVFLDLYSGSGAIGIEALSRGAKMAVFIEKDREVASCIHKNLEHTRLMDLADVLTMDVSKGLEKLKSRNIQFDIIFMDPPYDMEMERKALEYLQKKPYMHENTQIIVETSNDTSIDYIEDLHYHIERVKVYKTNQHLFLRQLL